MPDGPRVLIVGAGVGGLTLAAGLQKFGVVPTVVEIQASSLGRGLALMLTSNVGLALRRIGLDQAVAREAMVRARVNQFEAAAAFVRPVTPSSTTTTFAPRTTATHPLSASPATG